MLEGLGLFGLFLVSFLAATVFPFQSEAALGGMLVAGTWSPAALIAVASAGNTLGSVVNWLLGLGMEHFSHRRWFPVKHKQLERASRWYHKYGRWSLLLSWAPFIGDPLTVVAGVLREPFWSFFLIVAIAKTGRYIITAAIVLNVF